MLKRLMLLAACWGLMAGVSQGAVVAKWLCQDNAASTTIVAATGSNATLQGGDNTSTISEVNGPGTALTRSLHLNGSDDWIQITDLSGSLGTDASVCFWVRLDAATPASSPQTGFANLGAAATGGASHYPFTDGTIYCSVLRYTGNTTSNRVSFSPPGGVTRTNWHHIAITNTSGANGFKFYVDGSIAYQTTGNTLYYDSDLWAIGRSHDGVQNYYLDGRICDIRIYDNTLSGGDITTIIAEKDTGGGGGNGLVYPQIIGSLMRPTPWSRFLAHTPIALLEAR